MMKCATLLLAAFTLAACNPAPEPLSSKPAKPANAPVAEEWKPVPFDATAAKFIPNPRGRFFTEFKAVVDKSAKGEFETTNEYLKRVADTDVVLRPFSTVQRYAFSPEYADMTYNADQQMYEAAYSVFCQKGYPIKSGISCGMGSITDATENYSGQNAFGTSAQVTSDRGRDLYFVFAPAKFKGKQFRSGNGEYRLPLDCPVPIEKAKALQGRHVIAAIVVGLHKPEVLSGDSRYEEATVASPHAKAFDPVGIPASLEMSLCFVQETGEILHVSNYD
jgi:hypothetical protein